MKTKDVISCLTSITDQDKLARIWCDLNGWYWPEDLPIEFKPIWWDGHQYLEYKNIMHRKTGFVNPLMSYIDTKVDKKLIDKWWMSDRKYISSHAESKREEK